MNIRKVAQEVHNNAVDKGFWPESIEEKKKKNVGELLMLCVSELGEALEAHRGGKVLDADVIPEFVFQYDGADEVVFIERFKAEIKDSFQDEICDTIIRLLDLSAGLGIDIETHIRLKMRYNSTRKRLHGKAY